MLESYPGQMRPRTGGAAGVGSGPWKRAWVRVESAARESLCRGSCRVSPSATRTAVVARASACSSVASASSAPSRWCSSRAWRRGTRGSSGPVRAHRSQYRSEHDSLSAQRGQPRRDQGTRRAAAEPREGCHQRGQGRRDRSVRVRVHQGRGWRGKGSRGGDSKSRSDGAGGDGLDDHAGAFDTPERKRAGGTGAGNGASADAVGDGSCDAVLEDKIRAVEKQAQRWQSMVLQRAQEHADAAAAKACHGDRHVVAPEPEAPAEEKKSSMLPRSINSLIGAARRELRHQGGKRHASPHGGAR